MNFWDFEAWGFINILAVLLLSLLVANILKKTFKIIGKSLIPTSVLGGLLILAVTTTYKLITKESLFNTDYFGGNGMSILEVLTYHMLALGFIASALKISEKKIKGKRGQEVFDSGVTTVATYLLQGVVGLAITLIAALISSKVFAASGILLPFGYGQGSGQALNYGNMFQTNNGFVGGRNFGLTVAALGFLCASIGGVIHLNVMKKKGRFKAKEVDERVISLESVEAPNEIAMSGDMDKFTAQIILLFVGYFITSLIMFALGKIVPESLIATIYL